MHGFCRVENNVRGYCCVIKVSRFLKRMYSYILEASYHSYSTPEENLTQSSLAEFVFFCFICNPKEKKKVTKKNKQDWKKKGKDQLIK